MRWRCPRMARLSLRSSLILPDGILALIGPGVREHAQTDGLYADEPPPGTRNQGDSGALLCLE